jgi:AcrR family transcriptional regulator
VPTGHINALRINVPTSPRSNVDTASELRREHPPLREQKKMAARAEILRAARELLDAKGYKHTRMREIAQAARVSYQTLYNYFPAKSLIVQALLSHPEVAEQQHGRRERRLLEVPAEPIPCRRMRGVVERAFDAAIDRHRGLWREVLLDALRDARGEHAALALLAPGGAEAIFDAVRMAQQTGILSSTVDADALARLTCRVIDANLLQLLVQPARSRREASRTLADELDLLLLPYTIAEAGFMPSDRLTESERDGNG